MSFDKKTSQVLKLFDFPEKSLSSSEIAKLLKISQRTALRLLEELKNQGLIIVFGQGKNTLYKPTPKAILHNPIDFLDEKRLEKDVQIGLNFSLFDWFLKEEIFSKNESKKMKEIKQSYQANSKKIPEEIRDREMERLIVEFSWKSSAIEGNTYSLLDTEILLKEKKEAKGKTKDEAQMILNHKKVFDYLNQNPLAYKQISLKNLQEIHSLATGGLNIEQGFRNFGLGITGSLYRPLDNNHQIKEAVEKTLELINKTENPFVKSFFAWVMIPYIQPFSDGNKRTGRLLANAILYSYHLPLLSFRTTTVEEYKTATLVFYELNSLHLLKKIFLEQIQFFAVNYGV